MEDMERRIKRGDMKQEKLDAIQVGLSPIVKLTQISAAMHFSVKPVNQDA
jgi:hypothetical protein